MSLLFLNFSQQLLNQHSDLLRNETSCVVCFGGSGIVLKLGGGAGSCKLGDAEIFIGRDRDGEQIRGTAKVEWFGATVREAPLRWSGHVKRKDGGYTGQRMLKMELPGRRKRGKPQRRFMDAVTEDMKMAGVTEEEVSSRMRWRQMICCDDTLKELPKDKEEIKTC